MDYNAIGLKIGLEIHQQLNTGKLFCRCLSNIKDENPETIVTRRLRASAGETGETDVAAEFEMGKERHFVYQAFNDSTCAVELDEEPIHGMDGEALNTALQVSKIMNARTADLIQVMRKTVIDGSNTSGFQRTALVSINGVIKTQSGQIAVQTICVEEESAKIVEATQEFVIYNLSRLGIPLIEIATAPEIKTPEQAKEVAEHIGMILRSTGRVKRGIGTIRQDLNVSITRGARVEIKGAQDLKMLVKLAEMEVIRQQNLADVSQELKERKAEVSSKIIDITKLFEKSGSEMIKKSLESKNLILGIKLKGFHGLIKKEAKEGQRLGKELSAHARVYAKVGGSIHSDELPKYGINEKDVKEIRAELGCHEKDAFIFVIEEKDKAERGLHAIIKRAKKAIEGIPEEVRKANPDATTTFLRPMPGSARMYPETDIPLIMPGTAEIKMPELITEKAKRYETMGLAKDIAIQMAKSEMADDFEHFSKSHDIVKVATIAEAILSDPKEVKKRYNLDVNPTADDFKQIFDSLEKGKIAKDSILMILVELGKGLGIKEAIGKYTLLTDAELERAIKEIVAANKHIPEKAIIGKAMEQLRGKADGKKIVEIVNRLCGK